MGPRLRFQRIVITGPGRNYEVSFLDGVNIVTGPISTGKSSVLQLIDYVCCAQRAPSYPEISKCSDVYAELCAGEETLTIRRSLKSATAKATLYEGTIDDVFAGRTKGTELMARHVSDGASISSELLKRLELANIDVKTAPTQSSSDVNAYSLRDLMMLTYVDQDRMGSAKGGFFEDNPFKRIKWHAGVEIVHGLFEQEVASLSRSLKDAEDEYRTLHQYFTNARTFLDNFQIPSADELEKRINDLSTEQRRLGTRLTELRKEAEGQLGENLELVRRRTSLDADRQLVLARAAELRRTLGQLGRLRVQYERERAQLEFLKESKTLVSDLPVTRCPGCLQRIDPRPDASGCYVCHRPVPTHEGEVGVDARLRAARRRISDLEDYVSEIEGLVADLDQKKESLGSEIRDVDAALHRLRQAQLLPDTSAVVDVTEALSLLDKQRRQAAEHLDLRRRARGEGSALNPLKERIDRLRKALSAAEGARNSPAEVIRALSARFVEGLSAFRFPALAGAAIDEGTFTPLVRGQPYRDLSSKGAISLVIAAWHIAVLRYALSEGSKFPRLLLLDSPLSHVGKDATDETFKDQQIVDGFYQALVDLHRQHGASFQVIMVDNRPPKRAAVLPTVSFTGDPTKGRYGLIDDEHAEAGSSVGAPDGAAGERSDL